MSDARPQKFANTSKIDPALEAQLILLIRNMDSKFSAFMNSFQKPQLSNYNTTPVISTPPLSCPSTPPKASNKCTNNPIAELPFDLTLPAREVPLALSADSSKESSVGSPMFCRKVPKQERPNDCRSSQPRKQNPTSPTMPLLQLQKQVFQNLNVESGTKPAIGLPQRTAIDYPLPHCQSRTSSVASNARINSRSRIGNLPAFKSCNTRSPLKDLSVKQHLVPATFPVKKGTSPIPTNSYDPLKRRDDLPIASIPPPTSHKSTPALLARNVSETENVHNQMNPTNGNFQSEPPLDIPDDLNPNRNGNSQPVDEKVVDQQTVPRSNPHSLEPPPNPPLQPSSAAKRRAKKSPSPKFENGILIPPNRESFLQAQRRDNETHRLIDLFTKIATKHVILCNSVKLKILPKVKMKPVRMTK